MIDEKCISYRGVSLDRASELRKSQDWLQAQWDHPGCQVLILQNDLNYVDWDRDYSSTPMAIFLQRKEIESLLLPTQSPVFLGLRSTNPLFAIELAKGIQDYFGADNKSLQFIDLREIGFLLNHEDAALLAYARGLVYWNRHSVFCSSCGSPTARQQGGHAKLCSNNTCGRLIFPRTDPAVIMLVEEKVANGPNRCLLGRNSRFPERMMSTLAGFVDPSESLEETVRREVFEEAGIKVDEVFYQASQPWPFPASIMLGFRALALTTDIQVDGIEIEEANWFTAKELSEFGEWGDGNKGYCLPRHDSIARCLIESWISDQLQ